MAIKNYQCKKCGIQVERDMQPNNTYGCPNGGYHSWVCLGDYGDTLYQCSVCGTVVRSKFPPLAATGACPKGNVHKWFKL